MRKFGLYTLLVLSFVLLLILFVFFYALLEAMFGDYTVIALFVFSIVYLIHDHIKEQKKNGRV